MQNPSDMLLDLRTPTFGRGEALEIAEVSGKDHDNWTQRKVVDMGIMRDGRRLYSALDLIQLRIVGALTATVAMPPTLAAAAAKWARERALQMSERDRAGRLKYKGQAQEKRHYVVVWIEDGKPKINHVQGEGWLTKHAWPHPVTILPIDDIVLRTLSAAFDVLDRDEKAGAAQ